MAKEPTNPKAKTDSELLAEAIAKREGARMNREKRAYDLAYLKQCAANAARDVADYDSEIASLTTLIDQLSR